MPNCIVRLPVFMLPLLRKSWAPPVVMASMAFSGIAPVTPAAEAAWRERESRRRLGVRREYVAQEVAVIGMVEDVVDLPAKLQHFAVTPVELLEQGEIEIDDAWPRQDVAAGISSLVCPKGTCTKWAVVTETTIGCPFRPTYPLGGRPARRVGEKGDAVQRGGGIADIGTVVGEISLTLGIRAGSQGNSVQRGEGLATLHGSDAIQIPASQNGFRRSRKSQGVWAVPRFR